MRIWMGNEDFHRPRSIHLTFWIQTFLQLERPDVEKQGAERIPSENHYQLEPPWWFVKQGTTVYFFQEHVWWSERREGFQLRAASLTVWWFNSAGIGCKGPEEKVKNVIGVFWHFDLRVVLKRFKQQQRSERSSSENEPRSRENMLDYF